MKRTLSYASGLALVLLFGLCSCVRSTPKEPHKGKDSSTPDTQVDDSDSTETDIHESDTKETDTEQPPEPVRYTARRIVDREFLDLVAPLQAFTSDTNGFTYVIEEPGKASRTSTPYILDTYIQPRGSFCAAGDTVFEVKDISACSATYIHPGFVDHAIAPTQVCVDTSQGRGFFLSAERERFEVVDLAIEGESARTYNNPNEVLRFPDAVAGGALHGPCAYLPHTDELLLSPSDSTEKRLAFMKVGDGALSRELPFTSQPSKVLVSEDGRYLVLDAPDQNKVLRLDASTLATQGEFTWDRSLADFTLDARSGMVYLSDGAEQVAMVDLLSKSPTALPIKGIEGAPQFLGAHRPAGLLWVVTESKKAGVQVQLVQDGVVVDTQPIEDPVLTVASPGLMGDLVVFTRASPKENAHFQVFEAKADGTGALPPLYVYLFSTIEAPDDAGMTNPCDDPSSNDDFTFIRSLVSGNADVLASLGVPVALAVGDNYGEKSEECGTTSDYDDLVARGFELGALVHNRPCYNCTNLEVDGVTFNADYCDSNHADYARSSSTSACFPNDPEYCDRGDWDCYNAFMQPRVDFADRHIPGGATFLVGADRHGMWNYDWIKLYQEVDRVSQGKVGFEITMFGSLWAYNDIAFDDPRGKNPGPWRSEDRSAAWRLGDISNWDQDSSFSNLVYLPGLSSSSVKLAEQQETGLYMIDLLALTSHSISYEPEDYEVNYQLLRQALTFRDPDRVSSFYFHVHDTGVVNLADASGAEVMVDDGTGKRVPVSMFLKDFIARVNEDYVSTGEVVWMAPSGIRELWEDPR